MASSLDQRRGLSYPSITVDNAVYGFHMGGAFVTPDLMRIASEAGATMARAQQSWGAVPGGIENYDTGALSLSAGIQAGLDACVTYGIKPILVAGYGSIYKIISTPLLLADAPVGSYVLNVGTTAAALVDWPNCHIQKFPNAQVGVVGKAAYYGTLIASADATAGTITLASKTTVALTAGTKMQINRLKYQALPDKNLANPVTASSLAAYTRVVMFLANEIASRGLQGYVGLWNEMFWANDRWDSLAAFYDGALPSGVVLTSRGEAILSACLSLRPPAGVTLMSGMPEKTGGNGMLFTLSPQPSAADVQNGVPLESIHPYHVNPEGFMWDPSGTDGAGPYAMNPGDIGSNFRLMVRLANTYATTHGGVKPTLIATELGTGNPTGVGDATSPAGHAARARYLIRRVLTQWGCGVPPVIYALAAGSVFDVVNRVPTIVDGVAVYEKYPAYFALQRLMALVAHVGAPWPAVWAPSVVGIPDSQWPAMFATVHGQAGAVLFGWQRTYSEPKAAVTWGLIPHPDPIYASVSLTPGSTIAECVNVVTGATVTPTIAGNLVTLPLTDEAVALRVVAA